MTLAKRLAAAESQRQARAEGYPCPFRGRRTGFRECAGCGGKRSRAVFACAIRLEGATLAECRDCGERPKGIEELAPSLRRAICLACPQHRVEGGAVRCALCVCVEPWRTRPWCPAKRWGMAEWQRRMQNAEQRTQKSEQRTESERHVPNAQ